MNPRRLAALPIFWQTLVLLVAAVMLAQLVGFALLLVNPPPRPQFNRLTELVGILRAAPGEGVDRERPLDIRMSAIAPALPDGMISDPALGHELAERIGVADQNVRLFYRPERSPIARLQRRGRDPVSIRQGEALFFTPLVSALATPKGWRIASTPPAPLIAAWQRQMMLWFVASILALIPLAWAFARALSRPIRRFADAAERLGGDPQAPSVREEGPAELRTTARALNGMQARIAGYVGERTDMIGAIAHDLRTPLARIAFRVEGAPEAIRDKVMGDVDQMRAMLAATIGFVRSTSSPSPRVPVDLSALLCAIVDQEQDLGRPVTGGTTTPLTVKGDPLMIERLFQNLIDNGIAYGGAVDVALTRSEACAEVHIADRGPGLAPDLLARVFQPFVRGDPSRNRATGGIGLGLTIARTIAEDHGGTITLANRDRGGLEAVVALPLLA